MPSKKKVTTKPVAKKAAAKKVPVKPAKAVAKKAVAKKAAAKKTSAKKPAKAQKGATNSVNFSIQPRELLEKKALDKGESVEELISKRKVELMSVDDYLGVQKKQDYRNKPAIPGVYDLLIPPGTPRKLIIRLAKEHPVQIVRRDDIFVPVGVCDIERDLLAIRGDEKTIKKMEKILLQEIDSFIEGRDARLHDYSKPIELAGISVPGKKPKKSKA
jgi:hypothetical protein